MTDAAEKLKDELTRLSPADRAALAHFLIDSLTDDAGWAAAWDAELTARLAEIRDDPGAGEPAERVLREVRERYL